MVDGRETVGSSLGRGLLGGSETEAWRPWTEGKPWEIAWGELRWAALGGSDILRNTEKQSCWRVYSGQIHTNSINVIVPKNCAPKTFQEFCQRFGDVTCIASLAGSDPKNAYMLARVFHCKFHQCHCSEKLCAQDLAKFPNLGT